MPRLLYLTDLMPVVNGLRYLGEDSASGFKRSTDGSNKLHLWIGVQAMQLSPCLAGLAEQWLTTLSSILRFPHMLLSPKPFGVRLVRWPR